ncbi:Na+/H+ antiporter NhaD [Dethiosulfatibacter aminovorans DSM 17477]|uniref:Na+/H+ antiporter NhaD n=1 Tax=Dethiosulfatibacter aminovorans DSM 17477 TaxID=1121476 RepID=A0A1M6C2Y2_9FIRM|nr:SLC13 family permease [Dethiosulfatibacter aminovorans]SHI55405.1 Na+/H+ antiporter NhaD [Dethiosulfatibacter aminovorans DSM 17477]
MNIALVSLLSIVLVFVVGAFKKNPLHLGLLALAFAYFIGRFEGLKDVEIMKLFPTTLFVRVFCIMLFFGIAQSNGSLELLAKKMLKKTTRNVKLLPYFIFFTGVILGSIGINSLAGMAILSGIGISLALASGGHPLLFGIAGGYGVATGCYSPINEFTANITSATEGAGLNIDLVSIFIFTLIAYTFSFTVMYLLMGGHKAKGQLSDEVLDNLPDFDRKQIYTMLGIIVVLALVIVFRVDVGWAGLMVAIICILLGCSKSTDAIKSVSLASLILITGVGTLISLVSKLGGFELMSALLAKVMTANTVAPTMSLTSSAMSLFTLARLCVITLVPAIPGIVDVIPHSSANLAAIATSAGAFASSIGPLSSNGALIMQNLSQQMGEENALKYFTKQMVMGVVGAVVIALTFFIISLLGIF